MKRFVSALKWHAIKIKHRINLILYADEQH